MPKISKKAIREINMISVFEKILRDRFESSLTGFFFVDDRPEFWSDDQRDAFDMVTRVEDDLKAAILKVLGVNDGDQHTDTAKRVQPSPKR